MPARAPARSARSSTAASRKASGVADSRVSTASRASSTLIDVPVETPDNELRPKICSVFRDAQKTTATHRKLVVNLRKIQEACCYEPANPGKQSPGDFAEEDFNNEFVRCVLRVMPVKKSEGVGEKTVRFIGLFLRYASDKDNELLGEIDEDASVLPETPSTKLTTFLLDTVLPLLTSKDKFVRYRSTQLISHVINSLDAIDDELFQRLRHGLLKRIRDKEAMVRAQAVLGLGRLAGNQADEDANSGESDDDDAGAGLLEKLLEVLQNDPSADVRRSLLVNLPILPNTLPYLLERARDQDAATRRAVYSRLLPALGDFRHLSLSMREKLLRWGLRDRDENVRKAAARLFRERWIEDCAGVPPAENGAPQESSPPNFDALLELLERIDIVNSGVENGVALEAMKGFWEGRPDYRDEVTFSDEYWETLSAESVFMARSYNDFCRNEGDGKYEHLVEEKLPEVMKLAFYLERYNQALIDSIRRIANSEGAEEEEEEDTVEQEFIVEQLLHIALTLDYSDEVGRRKMFALMRQMLSIPELPDEITKLTVDVLRDMSAPDAAGEREFCSIVLESVADVHDTIVDDEPVEDVEDSFHSAKSAVSSDSAPSGRGRGKSAEISEEEAQEKAIREIVINMKCLHIVECMLSNVSGNLQQNDHLVAMLNNLVVPAVRSHEAPVRERGLVCLGLCSLLDKSLAEENLSLFMHFFTKGHAALQITALRILTDILNVHGAQLVSANPALLKIYVRALRSGSKAPEVQAAATLAVSKLLLGRVVTDPEASAELLRTLVVAYFDPATAGNQSVRQALNYFLPVFCFSRLENQQLMGSIALDAIHALFNIREGLEDDDADVEDEMTSLTAIGACLVDWTDPRKCYTPGSALEPEKKHVNGDVHLDLAAMILDKLNGNMSKDEKKVIAPLFGKLYISPASTEDKIRALYEDVESAVDSKLLADATSRNALYKIHVALGKIVNALGEQQQESTRRLSRSTSASVFGDDRSVVDEKTVVEERTVLHEPDIKEEDASEDEGTVVAAEQDSLVEDLLSDEEA
ncbi:related to condensin complex component cnd3 [Cephalotrichum gorgonifer]|uniref:Related to condensin complex component cnd3 n=1 Tax=Cephalotrichum gorgonifer TaxID=2041049 RepID=A0AAE8SS58_9PEZI|nr:related to condensin complex component cnd3 [Cephalotrichum gorgonifer]